MFAPSLYVQLLRKSSSPQLDQVPFALVPASFFAKSSGGPPVGYLAPCRYRICTWVIEHLSGMLGVASGRPYLDEGTEYQGENRPHDLRMSNGSDGLSSGWSAVKGYVLVLSSFVG